MNKYFLFFPQLGLNDNLVQLLIIIRYCKAYNRILLLTDGAEYFHTSCNFYDLFEISHPNIIYDKCEIRKIILENNFSVYPNNLNCKIIDILDLKIKFKYQGGGKPFLINGTEAYLPKKNINEDIIIYSSCGGGRGFSFFKELALKNNIKNICKEKMALLPDNYLCIQVRCTDLKCDYKKLYEDNKKIINSYNCIYIATDNKLVIDYFKSQKLNVFNFSTFTGKTHAHWCCNSTDIFTIYCDALVDIFIATNSNIILSNSKGGFVNLLRECFDNKEFVLNKLK
uniref:Uncharacterized protein n=1 Tax=viral metagenome TaxID=1070528 RepID=A0A6C0C3L8_9ZZZZ